MLNCKDDGGDLHCYKCKMKLLSKTFNLLKMDGSTYAHMLTIEEL